VTRSWASPVKSSELGDNRHYLLGFTNPKRFRGVRARPEAREPLHSKAEGSVFFLVDELLEHFKGQRALDDAGEAHVEAKPLLELFLKLV
jgi:hypothetical protein